MASALVFLTGGGHVDEGDAGLLQEAAAVVVGVSPDIDDALDAGVDDHFGAGEAGLMRDVDHAAVGTDAVEGGLDNGILLGMECAHAVAVDHQMADFVAVGQAGRRTIVAGGEDAPAADDDGADVGAIAGAARGDGECNLQKVLVP